MISLNFNYNKHLQSTQPLYIPKKVSRPPPGSSAAPTVIPPIIIPPLNTDINFTTLPKFRFTAYPHMARLAPELIPEQFDWHNSYPSDSSAIKAKKQLICKPYNQALCGCCWAVAGTTAIADNFVVTGLVDWIPNLSVTWCISTYPQYQCKGGNTSNLLKDISNGGITTNNCIDYSWCLENDSCNGSGMYHFNDKKTQGSHNININELSSLIPSTGCYYGGSDYLHYLYKLDPSSISSIALPTGTNQNSPPDSVTENNFTITVKKQIYFKGPVIAGFLVFNNFRSGNFTKNNGGVYLERGVYTDNGDDLTFDNNQVSVNNYIGSHAIAVIGWGLAKNILVDNNGKRADVPYWYCRNSWGDKWGEAGYFKMAMYPFNKLSQYDTLVQIDTPTGRISAGGMVIFTVKDAPVLSTFETIRQTTEKKLQPDIYYQSDSKIVPTAQTTTSNWIYVYIILGIILLVLLYLIISRIIRSHVSVHVSTPRTSPQLTPSPRTSPQLTPQIGRHGRF